MRKKKKKPKTNLNEQNVKIFYPYVTEIHRKESTHNIQIIHYTVTIKPTLKKKPLNQNSIYCRKKVNMYFFIEISRDSLEKEAWSLKNAD